MSEITKYIVFSVIFFLLYLVSKVRRVEELLSYRKVFISCLFGVLVIQLTMIFSIKFQVGDVMLFSDAGYYFRNGVDYYWIDSNHDKYPFFPFLIFFHALANKMDYIASAINFVQILKTLLLAALYLTARQLYLHASGSLARKRRLILEFLLNPITVSVVLFHGQIDIILISFFIYASVALMGSKSTDGKVLLSGLFFAASVASKTWSIVFLPVYLKFFGLRRTAMVGVVTLVLLFANIFIYTKLVFGSGFRVVLPALSRPGGPVGIWGISYFFRQWGEMLAANNLLIFAVLFAFGLAIIYMSQLDFWESVVSLILWVYLIIPNWGIQYLFWVVPFSYVLNKRGYKWDIFYMLAGIYVFLNYLNIIQKDLIMSQVILGVGLLLWFYIGYLTFSNFVNKKLAQ